ncbi:hypothetical protein F5051DRAFT_507571 [Lentinula edodes]|nr:hypothetical protein F5051DRAFT_507571 [Lentinula edodes]
MLSASDEERELEEQLRRDRERLQRFKEKRKAKEEAKRKAEEEAARRVAEEKKQREEAARARRREEEAADQRRRAAAAAHTRWGPSPSGGRDSPGGQKGEELIPERDDGDDGRDHDEEDEEWAPCKRCYNKRIPCLEQVGVMRWLQATVQYSFLLFQVTPQTSSNCTREPDTSTAATA